MLYPKKSHKWPAAICLALIYWHSIQRSVLRLDHEASLLNGRNYVAKVRHTHSDFPRNNLYIHCSGATLTPLSEEDF